ncbi:uncharacterized protein Triagg1_2615 [Trichoderma aggressivum f. europaeum]|uniref:Uncharacterized protein n=1 Tax=Trichoderma aggressivum f. europaeum TaxID=173218 RepID=A0AAE1IIH6_9HYPO|nr:hypothetical protein Triagg1_2615 [Trichoderma aggressivum f. europaeum]
MQEEGEIDFLAPRITEHSLQVQLTSIFVFPWPPCISSLRHLTQTNGCGWLDQDAVGSLASHLSPRQRWKLQGREAGLGSTVILFHVLFSPSSSNPNPNPNPNAQVFLAVSAFGHTSASTPNVLLHLPTTLLQQGNPESSCGDSINAGTWDDGASLGTAVVLGELLSSPRAVDTTVRALGYQAPSSTFAKLGGAGSGRKSRQDEQDKYKKNESLCKAHISSIPGLYCTVTSTDGLSRASHGVQGFTFWTGKRRVRADLTRDPGPSSALRSGRYFEAMRVHRYYQYSSHAHPKLTRDTGQAVAAHRLGLVIDGP